MINSFVDEGIVFAKNKFLERHKLITIFSRKSGKIRLFGYGAYSIISRRLSHLETGNYIKFSGHKKTDFFTLGETEIIWGFSKIKKNAGKLNILFALFFILNKILPENQEEEIVFNKTLLFLKALNNRSDINDEMLNLYLQDVLNILGFIDRKKIEDDEFDSFAYLEGLINQKIKLNFLQ